MPNSGAIFPITFNDCGTIFPILFFGHQVQNLYPVLGGGSVKAKQAQHKSKGADKKDKYWLKGLRPCPSPWKSVAIFPITFNDCGGIFPRRNFSGQKFSCTKSPPPPL